ncbi:MAG: flagellar assembly protein FliW [Spirochaetaceae bacterium]|nr:MAG: flagellar assembly protein FliW [Spirochaetaceae bacterium]
MTIDTKAYGPLELAEKQLVRFPEGLYGFEQHTEFGLLDAHRPPFYWLQSTHDREVAFILVNPYLFRSDYVLDIAAEDLEQIGSPEEDDILVFAILTIPAEGEVTANLQGPLVINRAQRIGKQSISLDPRWKTKHEIASEMTRTD